MSDSTVSEKGVTIYELVAVKHKRRERFYSDEEIRELFDDDPGSLVIGLLDRCQAAEAEVERLRAGLAKHYNNLRCRAECAIGGVAAAEVPTWCVICEGQGERGKSVDSVQHTPDCPVSLAAEAAGDSNE